MDPELKVKSCFKKPYDLVETAAAAGGPKSQNLHPLKVMLSPEITAESDENELTSLKNSNQENCNSSNLFPCPEEDLSNQQQQQIKFDIIKDNLHKRSDLIEENHSEDLEQPEKSTFLHSTIVAV